MKKPVAVDFETEATEPRPHYPPKPVGVAIKYPGKKAKYLAWGHPSENNSTKEDATRELKRIFAEETVVFHNGKFDLDVAETHLGITPPPPERVFDTMILAFLDDPHSRRLGLKELSVSKLNRPATERDELREWLIASGIVRKGATKQWGAHISKAPGGLVGKYASGDVEMTLALFDILYKSVKEAGMLPAHLREMKMIPILLANEREGVCVDLTSLRADTSEAGATLEKMDAWLRKYLKAPPDMNIDSDQELADALEKSGKVTDWILTDTGARSTAKDALRETMSDKVLLGALEYRSLLSNFHGTFMTPWLRVAEETKGRIHTNWNSTAQDKGGGTRTGRMGSTPNFQNIPSSDKLEDTMKGLVETGVFKKIPWLTPLPPVRQYVVADTKQHLLCDRDFNGQELRVAAHFEDADMMQAYKENPLIDLHQYGSDKIRELTGLDLHRKKVKIIVFTILYGGGLGTIAERLGTTTDVAKKLRAAYFEVFPDLKQMINDLQRRGKDGGYMTTWGGRRYYAEPSKVVGGRLREYAYKLVNYLIQGSSADITKEAMIRYNETRKDSRLIVQVHDELMICAPKKCWKEEMAILKEAMNSIELDVPMLSEGEFGYRWHDMKECA